MLLHVEGPTSSISESSGTFLVSTTSNGACASKDRAIFASCGIQILQPVILASFKIFTAASFKAFSHSDRPIELPMHIEKYWPYHPLL